MKKDDIPCNQVMKSYLPHKKVMKKYCMNGKEKLVHAGAPGYKNNYSIQAKRSFRARHNCDSAKPGTAQHLACTALWPKGKHNKWDTHSISNKKNS